VSTQGLLHLAACVGDVEQCLQLLDAGAEDPPIPVRLGWA
jgi:hypothetical protein